MALGRRPTDHQGELFVTTADLPRSAALDFGDGSGRTHHTRLVDYFLAA